MKTLIISLSLFLCGGAFSQTAPALGIRDKTPQYEAFTNARIVTSPDRQIDSGTLIIRDGIIEAIGENVPIPEGVTVHDLKGKSVYPGFIDPFTEYGINSEKKEPSDGHSNKPVYESERTGATSWNDAIRSHIDWADHFEPDRKLADEFRKLGFTSVLSARMDGILRGRGFAALLGEGTPNDLLLEPHGVHFASFKRGSSKQEYPGSQMGAIALLRQTFLDADWYHAARTAYETNPDQRKPELNSSIKALDEYESERFLFETSDKLSLLRVDRIAREFSLDVVLVGSNQEYMLIDEIQATDRTLILPLDFPEPPRVKSVGDELDYTLGTLRHWERAPSNPAVLEEAGITFAFTTHRLERHSDFFKKLRKTVEAGLSERAALSALTVIPSEICGLSDRIGTLEKGKLANFFICDGNPFRDKVTVYSTWVAGEEKEFIRLDQADFRGEYEAIVVGKTLKLILTKKVMDLRGTLSMDDVSEKLKDITILPDALHFNLTMDKFELPGVYRSPGQGSVDIG